MSSHNSFLKPVYEPHQRRRISLKFYSHIRRWCQKSETPESETTLWINEEEILEEWAKRCTQQNPGKTSNSFYIRNHKGGGLHCARHAIWNTVRPIPAGIMSHTEHAISTIFKLVLLSTDNASRILGPNPENGWLRRPRKLALPLHVFCDIMSLRLGTTMSSNQRKRQFYNLAM